MAKITRRDFLKLSVAAVGGATLAKWAPGVGEVRADGQRPNILILLFDTTSAPHLSLYGYPRETTPNLERIAGRATVYHAHYSGGSFTTPGTASLLTGLYPWHHRAVDTGAPMRRELVGNNLFRMVGEEYYRVGFSQNMLADVLLRQFNGDLDEHLPASSFAYPNPLLMDKAVGDPLPYYAFENFLVGKILATNPPASVSMGMLEKVFKDGLVMIPKSPDAEKTLPYNHNVYFLNSVVYQGLYQIVQDAARHGKPFLAYFHLFSPHGPYAPTKEFANLFTDDLKVRRKPPHVLTSKKEPFPNQYLDRLSQMYDRYITNVDAEIGTLMERLEASGLLDNTYVFLVSDHGQLFERGIHGHSSRLMYDQGIHIPLLVLSPGQTERRDVYVPTSNVDFLPTILSLTGGRVPDLLDGILLPGFGGAMDGQRGVFSMDAKESSAFRPFQRASYVMVRGSRKLIWYSGYPEDKNIVELYNLKVDPDEMLDLSRDKPDVVKPMLEELTDALAKADELLMMPS